MDAMRFKIWGLLLVGLLLSPAVLLGQNVVKEGAEPQKVTSGYQFTEGPYWHPDGFLLFSDIPANTIYKWEPGSDKATPYVKPSGHSNGITALPNGKLVIAQHDGMISMIDKDRKLHILAKAYHGKRLNSPNDVTVSSDGTIYFTDPPFGVSDSEKVLSVNGVYMLKRGHDPQLMFDKFKQPNGIVLSPDESKVYVNDAATGHIEVFDVSDDGSLVNPRHFASVGPSGDSGAADGMAVDKDGRLYSMGPGGIHVFNAQGERIQIIDLPARGTNMEWGGQHDKTLFITTPSAVYKLAMNVLGAQK